MFKLVTAVLCLAIIVHEGAALKCFVCNSRNDASCSDTFESSSSALRESFLEDCKPIVDPETQKTIEPFCKKTSMWLTEMTNVERRKTTTEVRVDRGCGHKWRNVTGPCYQTRADDHVVDTCHCNFDACNSADRPDHLGLMATIPALVVAAMRF